VSVAPHEITQHGTKPQPVVIAGKLKVSQKIHAGWPTRKLPTCGIMADMTEARTVEQARDFPSERGEFLLRGPAGMIECATDVPEPDCERPAAIIICHPHPLHGGNMHNKVVTILERSMRELGLRTVRFNFRGVGESE